MTAQVKRTRLETIEEILARKYVLDILSGLVPTDHLYDPIYDAVAKHGGTEFERRAASINIVAMANEIKFIRRAALSQVRS